MSLTFLIPIVGDWFKFRAVLKSLLVEMEDALNMAKYICNNRVQAPLYCIETPIFDNNIEYLTHKIGQKPVFQEIKEFRSSIKKINSGLDKAGQRALRLVFDNDIRMRQLKNRNNAVCKELIEMYCGTHMILKRFIKDRDCQGIIIILISLMLVLAYILYTL